MRAIDSDIDLLTASAEHDRAMLQRCPPSEEPYWQRRVRAADAARDALADYQAAIDAQPQPSRLTLED